LLQANKCPGSEVFYDHLFTSFPLLDKLSEMNIKGTGTVRQNWLNKISIIKKKDLEKKIVQRGTTSMMYHKDQVLVALKYSKAVYAASNKHLEESSQSCR